VSAARPRIPITRPVLGEAELEAVRRPLLSGWVAQGPEVAAFERELAGRVGARHACAVSSGTAALHLALLALGVGLGDEVVTVSHSFIATANAVRYTGATPVFVDIEPATFNLDPRGLAAALSSRTRALLVVHQLGMPCDLDAILAFAGERSLPVVEDAACALGSELRWRGAWERIGKPHGDIACFSFHPRKVITTGEGGMLTTASRALDATFRRLRQHAPTVPRAGPQESPELLPEAYSTVGFNYRMTDLQAAVGRAQLARLGGLLERRRALAARYGELLGGCASLALPVEPEWARSNWQSYCVRLRGGPGQRAVRQRLLDEGIATRRGVTAIHREPAYSGQELRVALPESARAQDECVMLPLYPQLTDEEQDRVAAALLAAVS
jgi:perosamine synthetase